MSLYFLNEIVATVFAWTGKTSLQATVLIVLVWSVQSAGKRLFTSRWHYALGLLILLRLALPVAPASSFSVFNLARLVAPHPLTELQPSSEFQTTVITALPVKMDATVCPLKPITVSFAAYAWLLGCLALLVKVFWQQRMLTLLLRDEPVPADPRLLALLEGCKQSLGIRRNIRLLATRTLSTPAICGVWRPKLLVPKDIFQKLNANELRLIFLHELMHLKSGDLIVNWMIIFVRALHWFNPLVWLALKNFRADRELACDATVLARLAASDRRLYGETLLKLFAELSPLASSPVAVPFITSKQLIKRRITMIAKFNARASTNPALPLTFLIILGSATFTSARLAEPPSQSKTIGPIEQSITRSAHPQKMAEEIQALEQENAKLKQQVNTMESELEKLRIKLGVPEDRMDGIGLNPKEYEALIHYSSVKAEAEGQYEREEALLKKLQGLSPAELRQVLPTVFSDATLDSLFKDLNLTQARIVVLRVDYGPNHPDVQRMLKLRDQLNKDIDERVAGVMKGHEVRAEALKAVVESCRHKAEEIRLSKKAPLAWNEYFEKKAELERLRKERDVKALRIFQEQAAGSTSASSNNPAK